MSTRYDTFLRIKQLADTPDLDPSTATAEELAAACDNAHEQAEQCGNELLCRQIEALKRGFTR